MEDRCLPDANALVDPAESFKNEKAGILDEVLKASNQEEVIHQNLQKRQHFSSSRAKNLHIHCKLHSYRFK